MKWKRILKWQLLIVLPLFMLFMFKADKRDVHASSQSNIQMTVNTNVTNADQYPAIRNNTFSYSSKRIKGMTSSTNQYASYPNPSEIKALSLRHGQSTTYTWTNVRSGELNLYWFGAATNTPPQYSLESVTFSSSRLSYYTYTDNGRASVYPSDYNWLEFSPGSRQSQRSFTVTLNFKYNPDIGSVPPEDPPDPSYSKQIDYLGDGGSLDTTANGPNDYRIYLDVTTEAAREVKTRDIVFLLDMSNSMTESLGRNTRFVVMKQKVIEAISSLTQDPNNRISIIPFGTRSTVGIERSSNETQLINYVNGLRTPDGGDAGGTNYYEALIRARSIRSDRDENIVFLLSDGESTAAQPATNATGQSYYSEIAMVYARDAARNLSYLDGFYSIFIGSSLGNASALQSVTQATGAKEMFTVQATNENQMDSAITRFVSKVSNSLYNIEITDTLSQYVDYRGDLKVVQHTEGSAARTLVAGIDYTATVSGKQVKVQLLKDSLAATRYAVSFNVRASDQALIDYQASGSYPHIGEAGTDYGGSSSSGMPGYFSNASASLTYEYVGGSKTITYNRPVIQVVLPDPIPLTLELNKVLTGKTLFAGQFSFQVSERVGGNLIPLTTVTNLADGRIVIDSIEGLGIGTCTYVVEEIIPDEPEPGMVYDTKSVEITVNIRRVDDVLVADISYSGSKTFTNRYEPTPVDATIEAKKVLIGRILTDGEFEFSLLDSVGTTLELAKNDVDGNIVFSSREFTQAGEYKFAIRESIPVHNLDPTVTYDLRTLPVTIVVTDIGGALAAEIVFDDDTFVNKVSLEPLEIDLNLHVILTGMQLSNEQFSFEIKGDDILPKLAKNSIDGTIGFEMVFSDPGHFHYTVVQVLPSELMRYMTYDTREFELEVVVSVVDGELVAEVLDPDGSIFYNRYQVRGGIW